MNLRSLFQFGIPTILVYLLVFSSDLFSTQGLDHNHYRDTILGYITEGHKSLILTSNIIRLFPSINSGLITFFLIYCGLAVLLCSSFYSYKTYLPFIILTIPAVLQFRFISKEIIFIFISFLLILLLKMVHRKWIKISLFIYLLIFLGIFFRDYYLISAVIFVLSILFSNAHKLISIITLTTILIFGPIIFSDQASRIIETKVFLTNFASDSGSRSSFSAEGPSHGYYSIYVSYFDTVLDAITQFLYSWDFRDFLGLIHVLLTLLVLFRCYQIGDKLVALFSFSIIATLPFFIMDLGTLVRHLSAQATIIFIGLQFGFFGFGSRIVTKNNFLDPPRKPSL
jgi:hypothetical protein